jgi:hypothetical protein
MKPGKDANLQQMSDTQPSVWGLGGCCHASFLNSFLKISSMGTSTSKHKMDFTLQQAGRGSMGRARLSEGFFV